MVSTSRRTWTHAAHLELLRTCDRDALTWDGPRTLEYQLPTGGTALWCARRGCVTPLDPVLLSEGWKYHPTCDLDLPELRTAGARAARRRYVSPP